MLFVAKVAGRRHKQHAGSCHIIYCLSARSGLEQEITYTGEVIYDDIQL
jgi:hypothetical protein